MQILLKGMFVSYVKCKGATSIIHNSLFISETKKVCRNAAWSLVTRIPYHVGVRVLCSAMLQCERMSLCFIAQKTKLFFMVHWNFEGESSMESLYD